MAQSLIVSCYFAKHPERIARGLNLSRTLIAAIKKANEIPINQKMYVHLMSSRYGHFWFTSNNGYFFEINRDNITLAIESLEEPFKRFTELSGNNKTLYVHYSVGTKYSQLLVDTRMTELREKLLSSGYRISVLV